jgi:hypothetical protein
MHDEDAGDVIDLPARPKLPPRFDVKAMIARHQAGGAETAATPPADAEAPAPPDAETEAPDAERLDPLPRPGDAYEKAYGKMSRHPIPSVFFLAGGAPPVFLSYSHFERGWFEESGQPGAGPILVLRFTGSELIDVRIAGRNLYPLADGVSLHLVHWVRALPPGMDVEGDVKTVISKIVIGPAQRQYARRAARTASG